MPGRTINKIVELLKVQGRQDKELCNHIGIAQSTFTNWKKRNTDPKPNYLPEIANFFNVSVDYLVSDEKDDNTKPQSIDLNDEINRLLYALTGEQSAYFSGDLVSEEGKLALINSLKQDLEFLKATTKK